MGATTMSEREPTPATEYLVVGAVVALIVFLIGIGIGIGL
jgi:hypothetical protein